MSRRQPMQSVYRDKQGVVRFRENRIVRYLLDNNGKIGMNELAVAGWTQKFSKEDAQQFAQLIGYSLGGYSELPYVTDAAWRRAVAQKVKR